MNRQRLIDDKSELLCPTCGFDHHHIRRVGAELDVEGYETLSVRIDIDGECGHSWSLILRQHKGRIQIEEHGAKPSSALEEPAYL